MMSTLSFLGMIVSLIILTFARLKGIGILIGTFKTLCSLLFLTTAYFAHKEGQTNKSSTYFKLIMTALIFSLFGDVFLLFKANQLFFTMGVISFAGAHISFTLAFFQFGKLEKRNLLVTVLLFALLAVLMLQEQWFDLGSLKPIIFIYGFLLSFMTGKSLSVLNFKKENPRFTMLTLDGAILFWISDFILLFAFFSVNHYEKLEILNNIVYFIGQGLFALSLRYELAPGKGK